MNTHKREPTWEFNSWLFEQQKKHNYISIEFVLSIELLLLKNQKVAVRGGLTTSSKTFRQNARPTDPHLILKCGSTQVQV